MGSFAEALLLSINAFAARSVGLAEALAAPNYLRCAARPPRAGRAAPPARGALPFHPFATYYITLHSLHYIAGAQSSNSTFVSRCYYAFTLLQLH